MRTAIIICSRSDSSRLPAKCFLKIKGKPILYWLIKRLQKTGLPIHIAIPTEDEMSNDYFNQFARMKNVTVDVGVYEPMERMLSVAKKYRIDNIVRVCHDKIFVEPSLINEALFKFIDIDLLVMGKGTIGSGFELFTTDILEKAFLQSKVKIEHITYAIRFIGVRENRFNVSRRYRSGYRLLIDYQKDFNEIKRVCEKYNILSKPLNKIINILSRNNEKLSNELARVTVYTSAFNASKWVDECMASVRKQKIIKFEYRFLDDGSTDDTYSRAVKHNCRQGERAILFVGEKNTGLASTSNYALSKARGEYIIRIDADDYFVDNHALAKMVAYMEANDLEALYPANQFQKGNENHHIGCAMFKTSAINAIKFNAKLRGYEGYDFFLRAKDVLRIGYMDDVIYHYRQHDDSMSKTNLDERMKIKEEIECTCKKENTPRCPLNRSAH